MLKKWIKPRREFDLSWLLRVWINDQVERQNLFYPGNIDLSIFTRV